MAKLSRPLRLSLRATAIDKAQLVALAELDGLDLSSVIRVLVRRSYAERCASPRKQSRA
jgi:hypothetical protein